MLPLAGNGMVYCVHASGEPGRLQVQGAIEVTPSLGVVACSLGSSTITMGYADATGLQIAMLLKAFLPCWNVSHGLVCRGRPDHRMFCRLMAEYQYPSPHLDRAFAHGPADFFIPADFLEQQHPC